MVMMATNTPHTIKKCIPVFDAITAGYILYTQVDIQVSQQMIYHFILGQTKVLFLFIQ
jgi:hypothetical protein